MNGRFINYDIMAKFTWHYLGKYSVDYLTKRRKISKGKLRKNTKDRFKYILGNTIDIDGSPLRFNLVFGSMIIAIIDCFPDLTEEEIRYILKSMFRSRFIKKIKSHSDIFRKMREKASNYKPVNENDWEKTLVKIDDPNEFTIHYTKCGLCTLFKQWNKSEWTKYLCELDYIMFKDTTIDLIRTKTLANGDDYCDFRMINNKVISGKEVMKDENISEKSLI